MTDLTPGTPRVAPDPVTDDGVADIGYSWVAWFIDPYGNCLAIVQAKD